MRGSIAESALCREKNKMRYPQSFIDTLKSRFSVSQVVGTRVALKRHGREFMGLCPFHKEKSPSFTVNDEKGFYHCFGCGAHGDAIGFIKEIEGLNYKEAIERLAAEAGMALPQPTQEEQIKERVRSSTQEVCELACRWFESQLMGGAGMAVRDYVASRGITPASIATFRIGFAPDDREALAKALIAQGVSQQQMIDAGLLIAADGRSAYSRFRGRLMFPIRDKSSKVIAFGGRILPGISAQADAAKYLNSPETELFHKGHQLYNYDLARKAAYDAQGVIVCEGYMDVIALHQAGIQNAVAPLGTAVTEHQLQLLWQLADVPVMCLDGDAAGARAMRRAGELALPLLQPAKSLKFVQLPSGEDPDSMMRSGKKDRMLALCDQAPALADMLWQQVISGVATTPEAKAGQEKYLYQLADQIKEPTVRSHYRSFFKQKLWESQMNAPRPKIGDRKGFQATKVQVATSIPALSGTTEMAVKRCLALALLYPQLLQSAQAQEQLACLPVIERGANALREAMLDYAQTHDVLTRDGLREALAEQADAMAALTRDPSIVIAADMPHVRVERFWQIAVNAFHLGQMEQERAQIEQLMATQNNDENNQRQLALHHQLEAMKKERDRLTLLEQMEEV